MTILLVYREVKIQYNILVYREVKIQMKSLAAQEDTQLFVYSANAMGTRYRNG